MFLERIQDEKDKLSVVQRMRTTKVKVLAKEVGTDTVLAFPSIYAAGKKLHVNPGIIHQIIDPKNSCKTAYSKTPERTRYTFQRDVFKTT